MGYVLPVNHYQYYNYQKRAIQEKQNPFYIERPAKVLLKQINRQNQRWDQTIYKPDENADFKLRRPHLPESAALYAQLTGEGQRFDQMV